MDNQEIQNEEIEINLAELFQVLKEHLHIIIISTLICAILVGAFTIFFVSKKYESTARIFPKPEVNEGIVDYSQINSNNSMTKNYIALLGGNNIQSKVAKELNVVQMLFLLLYLFQMKQIPKLFLFQQQQLIHNSVKKLLIQRLMSSQMK